MVSCVNSSIKQKREICWDETPCFCSLSHFYPYLHRARQDSPDGVASLILVRLAVRLCQRGTYSKSVRDLDTITKCRRDTPADLCLPLVAFPNPNFSPVNRCLSHCMALLSSIPPFKPPLSRSHAAAVGIDRRSTNRQHLSNQNGEVQSSSNPKQRDKPPPACAQSYPTCCTKCGK